MLRKPERCCLTGRADLRVLAAWRVLRLRDSQKARITSLWMTGLGWFGRERSALPMPTLTTIKPSRGWGTRIVRLRGFFSAYWWCREDLVELRDFGVGAGKIGDCCVRIDELKFGLKERL